VYPLLLARFNILKSLDEGSGASELSKHSDSKIPSSQAELTVKAPLSIFACIVAFMVTQFGSTNVKNVASIHSLRSADFSV
jgi:hypothetical protein